MSTCTRCGAPFSCAMADASDAPCWCLRMPPVVAVPRPDADGKLPGCWCPDCLRRHIAEQAAAPAPAAD